MKHNFDPIFIPPPANECKTNSPRLCSTTKNKRWDNTPQSHSKLCFVTRTNDESSSKDDHWWMNCSCSLPNNTVIELYVPYES
mmetsp:Transcript_13692/g.24789  ORF Transcript_13692/g.24789 Transcript_13692/m.24789 type:complete len:83 (+) Transcript_13692:46-294(+)